MEQPFLYVRDYYGRYVRADGDSIISAARFYVALKFKRGEELKTPNALKEAIQLQMLQELGDSFGCLFLDDQKRVITFEKLFRGLIGSASYYIRIVVQRTLVHHAEYVVFAHHYSGGIRDLDVVKTEVGIHTRMKAALDLIGITVLDHYFVTKEEIVSILPEGEIHEPVHRHSDCSQVSA